jgi:GTP-binding protein Era
MVRSAADALNESDVVLFITEPFRKMPEGDVSTLARLKNIKTPVILVINKIDTVKKPELLKTIDAYRQIFDFREIFPVSALKADNTDALLESAAGMLPEGPMYFPEDMITDQPERQIAAELIREKALMCLQEEIPHGLAVKIETMRARENKDIVDVEANLFCEKDSHKPIIIGKNGDMLKRIGSSARREIEALLGSPINLQIWVKVKKNWRDSDMLLKNFGYDPKSVNTSF